MHLTKQGRTNAVSYGTVGSEKSNARSEAGPVRNVDTQRTYGTTVVSTVQRVIA